MTNETIHRDGRVKSGDAVNIVSVQQDDDLDKYSLFEKAIATGGFYSALEREWKKSGKSKDDFKISIKPNISMMLRRDDIGTYTDPFLVIYIIREMVKRGYRNISVVESQNLYGNWFQNRSVIQVAARAGYFGEVSEPISGEEKCRDIPIRGQGVDVRVPLVDLTLDKVPHTFDDETVLLGKTWIDADFRLNISAFKAHFYGHYTIAIKNVYGCLPEQDKVVEYHCKQKVGDWTARLIHAFPVHFSIAAGYASADGWFGVKMKAIFKKTHLFIAGEDILAVDHAGAQLMGLAPEKSVMYTSLIKYIKPRPYQIVGTESPIKAWRTVPEFLVMACNLIEKNANAMDYGGFIATGGNDPCFPRKENYGGSFGNAGETTAQASDTKKVMGFLKTISYYLTLPAAFCLDVDIVRLNFRKQIYKWQFFFRKQTFPILTGSETLMSRFMYLSPEDLKRLSDMLRRNMDKETMFSGHIIFNGEKETAFPARMFTSTIAVVEILNFLTSNNMDMTKFKHEVDTLIQCYPRIFGRNTRYSYCFR